MRQFAVVLSIILMTGLYPETGFSETEFVFGGVPNTDPFVIGEKGEKGIYVDIFSEMAKRTGLNLRIGLFPFMRAYNYAKDGTIDGIVSIYHTKEREEYLIFSEQPLMISQNKLFVKKGGEFEFKSVVDLYGKSIGKILNWTVYNDELDKAVKEGKINYDDAGNFEMNLKKLMAGRIDGFIGTNYQIWFAARNLGFTDQISELPMSINENRAFFAVSRKSKKISDKTVFADRLNSAFKEIRADGTYDKIVESYLRVK